MNNGGSSEDTRLGSFWIRQQSSFDVGRIKTVIKRAMDSGQTSVTVLRLRLGEHLFIAKDEEESLSCPAWKVREIVSKERANAKHATCYVLHTQLIPVIQQAVEQEGLAWCICNSVRGVDEVSGEIVLDPIHALLVYWHPSTASEGQPNHLHKYYISCVMQAPIDEGRLKRYFALIKGAMDAGQNASVLTMLGKCSLKESPRRD